MDIQSRLISWYRINKRDLPWRETNDPYFIWLSEIILQQTRVAQGLDYYENFSNKYPNIRSLAEADLDDILKMWQGLGYYSRARNLWTAANQVVNEFHGEFPNNFKDIQSLKGVGPYTAAAIASFAFKIPAAVVDGNVSRVISRLFDLDIAINSTEGKKVVQELADSLISQEQPDLYNQAIMEIGALVCKPSKPECDHCPLDSFCLSKLNKTQQDRPVKIAKSKPKEREIHYLVLDDEEGLIVKQRTGNDIWKGLWDFPELECAPHENPESLQKLLKSVLGNHRNYVNIVGTPAVYTHILTHQRISAYFWRSKSSFDFNDNSIYLRVPIAKLDELAVPRLIHKYLIDQSYLN
jgi:A/G-specific adenine glycosylase